MLWLVVVAVLSAALALALLRRRLHHVRDRGDLQAAIDAEMRKALRRGGPQGWAVGVVKDGRVWFKGYAGSAQTQGDAPAVDTVFQLASVSKVFTACVLQALVDRGALRLDATLGELLGARMPLSPRASAVTLRQLATHTAGFPRVPRLFMQQLIRKVGRRDMLLDPYSHLSVDDVQTYLATTPDMRRPGRFAYSNYGMGLLGHVMEWTQGRPLGALAHELLFEPLAMGDCAIDPPAEALARRVPGHDAKGRETPPWTFGALAGAGGFHGSAKSMTQFIVAQLDDQHPLAPTLRRTWIAQPGGRTGLGWMRCGGFERFFGHREMLWHNGLVGGYASFLAIDPVARTGLVVLTNRFGDTVLRGMMLMRAIRTQSWSTEPQRGGVDEHRNVDPA